MSDIHNTTIATEADAVASIAVAGAKPQIVHPSELYTVTDRNGETHVLDLEKFDDAPHRAAAKRLVRDAESFVGYIGKHGLAATEVWADMAEQRVVGVIDAHEGAGEAAGWEGHRVTLEVVKTPSWIAWETFNEKLVPQDVFAEFIEANAPDVARPTSAEMLEVAQKFTANTRVDFESGHRTDSGQVRLEYKETISAKVGQKGNIDVPSELLLNLRPFLGAPIYAVKARFRYRITPQGVLLGFILNRPQDVLNASFEDIVAEIRDGKMNPDATTDDTEWIHRGISQPIYFGRPSA